MRGRLQLAALVLALGAILLHSDTLPRYWQLQRTLTALLDSPALRNTRYGIGIYSLDADTMVFERGLRQPLTPASLTKLFYTAAAYATMGPDYRVRTVAATDGTLRDGVLEGNLYLVGHGDCLLSIRDLEDLADRLTMLGIRRITGSIIADASYFDSLTNRQRYSGDTDPVEPLPPITALGVENNLLTVLVTRGQGSTARVMVLPVSEAVAVSWSSLPTPTPRARPQRRKRGRYGDALVPPARHRRAAVSPIRVSSALRSDGVQVVSVHGTPRPHSTVSFTVHMLNPPLVAAGVFKRCLQASGISVAGSIRTGVAPPSARQLAAVERPLAHLIELCNKNSNNFVAEHVMKILGAYCCGNTACNINAYRTAIALLDSAGIHTDGCVLHDGSGLSRRNRVTVASVLGLLRYCAKQPWGDAFFQTLAIAGKDGTLKQRMRRTAAEGTVRAKTGTHRNVSGLAGIVRSASGERFLFAMLWNGNSVGAYKQLENHIAEVLASFLPEATAPSGEASSGR